MTAKNRIAKFTRGFFYPFNSIAFLHRNRSLYKFAVLPFLINVLVFTLVVYFSLSSFQALVMARLPQGDAWYWLILHYFVLVAAVLVIMTLVFFSFAVIGSLVASPFNDVLSERTAGLLNGVVKDEPFVWKIFWQDTVRVWAVELKKIAVFMAGMLALLLLQLVPVLGTALYPALSVVWTALFLVLEYNGYVFTRRRLTFRQQWRIICRHPASMSGFGLGIFCVLAIPFIQFFCIPLGVVGAARLLYDIGELG
ncbi:MAG: cysteine biosynthesis protein CysZ [Deltaproteobacteria bacterium]|nr:cysteine biosynthesis protein CysZ [Deltaproteobacteria bacterium]